LYTNVSKKEDISYTLTQFPNFFLGTDEPKLKLSTLIIISSISLVSISLIITSALALTSFSSEFEETVVSDVTILTSNTMDKINRMMNERIIDIKLLTSRSNLPMIGDHHTIEEKIDYLKNFESQTEVYSSISIYNTNGIKIGDTRNLEIGLDESQKPFFIEAVQGKIFRDKVPIQSESLEVPIIHFSGPLYDDDGNITGVLVLRFSLSEINEILAEDVIYSKPIDVFLISNEGLILYSNPPQQGILNEVMDLIQMQNFLQSTDNSISFFEFNEEEENDELFTVVKQKGFHQYEGDDWILVFDIPSSVLFEERDNAIIIFVMLAGIILGIAIFASVIISRSISNPIKKLENEMKKVGRDDMNIEINLSGSEEIQSMSKSFHKMIKELKKISVQKLEFSSMIAHELRTPLTPIRSYAELLLQTDKSLTEDQRRQIKVIKDNAISLSKLITDLSDIQKLDLNVLKLNKENAHIADPINQSIVNFRQDIEKMGISLTTSIDETVTCFCDKQRIEQVMNNFITNSMDFCPKTDGKINIVVCSTDDFVEIIIEDNGSGIPKDQIDKIFGKFYQADSSMTRKHGGTGLGLSISKGIIEKHGGIIKVKSKIGQGTKIHVFLPKKYDEKNSDINLEKYEKMQI